MIRILTRVSLMTLLILCMSEGRAEALRCQQRLVSIGESAYRVSQLCGEPQYVVRAVEYRSIRNRHQGHAQEIQVELWTYDFGRHRFMRELRFENGILISMRSLGYGSRVRKEIKVSSRCPAPARADRAHRAVRASPP